MLCESLDAFCVDTTSLYQSVKSEHKNSLQGCNNLVNLYERSTLITFVIVSFIYSVSWIWREEQPVSVLQLHLKFNFDLSVPSEDLRSEEY
jgi:hypothetical protein